MKRQRRGWEGRKNKRESIRFYIQTEKKVFCEFPYWLSMFRLMILNAFLGPSLRACWASPKGVGFSHTRCVVVQLCQPHREVGWDGLGSSSTSSKSRRSSRWRQCLSFTDFQSFRSEFLSPVLTFFICKKRRIGIPAVSCEVCWTPCA